LILGNGLDKSLHCYEAKILKNKVGVNWMIDIYSLFLIVIFF